MKGNELHRDALIGFKGLPGLVSDIQPALKDAAKVAASAAAREWPATLPVDQSTSPGPARVSATGNRVTNTPPAGKGGLSVMMWVGLAIAGYTWLKSCDSKREAPDGQGSGSAASVAPAYPAVPPKPAYVRPATAENGRSWPAKSGPIRGFPVRATGGYSTVTVDNTGGGGDVCAKLFALGGKKPRPVRTFFIKEGESYKIRDIRPGSYDVRYQDLDSGRMERTDSFDLRQEETYEGVRYSNVTFTLYTVAGGNMRPQSISEDDFKDEGAPPAAKYERR